MHLDEAEDQRRAKMREQSRRAVVRRTAAGLCVRCLQPLDMAEVASRRKPAKKAITCRGCLAILNSQYRTDPHRKSIVMLRGAQNRAKEQGVACDLDRDWIKKKLAGRCELTGLPFMQDADKPDQVRYQSPFSPSLDRIVAGGSYTKDNCRMVLWAVNLGMSHWGESTYKQIAQAFVARAS